MGTPLKPARRARAILLLSAPLLALAACSGGEPAADSSGAADAALLEPASSALPDVLDDTEGLQAVAEGLKETGLAGIFEGNGSYTLLAPDDDAFTALGDAGKQLTGGENNAALAALLKDHMLPGYVTPADISAAIASSPNGEVIMPTMSGKELTFTTADDGAITVIAPDGSEASFSGDAVAGGQSVAIPISGLLEKVS